MHNVTAKGALTKACCSHHKVLKPCADSSLTPCKIIPMVSKADYVLRAII
jgi:hypothetical protein